MVVIRAKMLVVGKNWLCSGQIDILSVQSGCIWARWLYLGKSCCIMAKVVCISGKVV